ncbi:MAG: PAS domain-containing sensor histidine kinase [Methanosarcinales archaeon]|nr:PAS domain-containing sensor histidine kinase [Methanosarcinales archaeon]
MNELKEKYKITIMAILLGISCYLTYYFHAVLEVEVVFTHFFYVPIILAALWWKRKGLAVAIFLAVILIIIHLLTRGVEEIIPDYPRALMFIIIALIVATLCGWIEKANEELRVSEKRLRETKDYLDSIIESSADAVVVVDMEGIVQDWNKSAEGIMDYRADEAIGTSNKKFFADHEEADRIMELVWKEGVLKNYRTIVLRKDGKLVHASMSAALLRDKNGVPVGTVRVSRDITKEVALEERIKEERDNRNLIFESMADGVYIVSKDYEVEFMNKVFSEEFGGHVGDICYKVFHNREEPCPLCKSAEVMKGKTVRREWCHHKANKTYDLIETPLRNVDGSISKITIFRDITERMQAEKALRESLEKLEERDKMKTDLLNVASHEMRSPLAPIVANASLLKQGELTEKQKRSVFIIEKSAEQLGEMIERMLELARIDAGKVELTLETVSIVEIVKNVLGYLKPLAEVKKQTITIDVPERIEIEGDEQKITAIFDNLGSNAIKYTGENGKIDIKVADRGEDLLVCVADTGIGISKEHLSKVFEHFYMVDTSLSRKGGFGLGLPIAKGCVKLHGGKVWVTSEHGKGSKFFFTLPKKQKSSAKET